jgi:hypothetical protein
MKSSATLAMILAMGMLMDPNSLQPYTSSEETPEEKERRKKIAQEAITEAEAKRLRRKIKRLKALK